MIKLTLRFFQMLSMRIIGNKRHYLDAPHSVLPETKVDRIYKLWHITMSIVITVLITLKLFPLLSADYDYQLQNEGDIVPITFIGFFIPVILITGIVIEKNLMRNPHYKRYAEGLN